MKAAEPAVRSPVVHDLVAPADIHPGRDSTISAAPLVTSHLWWLHPGRLTAYFIIPLYVFLVYVVPSQWPDILVLKAADYIHGGYAESGLLMLCVLSVCSFIGTRVVVRHESTTPGTIPVTALALVGTLTIVAYCIWFFPIALRGQLLLERDDLSQTPGVTSFTQMGVPFVLCYLYCSRVARQRFPRIVPFQFRLILLLTVMRVFAWKERLAAIEVFVPAVLLVLTHHRAAPPRGGLRFLRKSIARGGPFLALPVFLVVFTVTEYFRSWSTYSETQSAPLTEFMIARITSYYYTALNNGAGMLATRPGEWPAYKLLFTAEWIYRLPGGVGEALYRAFIGDRAFPADDFLTRFGDPEFNNMSGLFPIVYDLDVFGGCLYFAAFGMVAGMLYTSMMRRGPAGSLLYPPFFVGILEVMRVAYVNGSRTVLVFAGAIFLLSQMRRAGSRPSARVAQHDGAMPV